MGKEYPASAGRCTTSDLGMNECDGAAPSHIYKADSTCHATLKECWPLNVRGLVFEVKRIGQSTPHPGCLNTISVTLKTNVPLVVSELCQAKVTLTGLKNAQLLGTGSEVALAAPPGQCDVGALSAFLFRSDVEQLSGFGKWIGSANNRGVELYSAQRSQAGQQYIFSFQVRNPMSAQTPQTRISIQSMAGTFDGRAGIPSHRTSADVNGGIEVQDESAVCYASANQPGAVDMTLPDEAPCCLCDVAEGDARPMRSEEHTSELQSPI